MPTLGRTWTSTPAPGFACQLGSPQDNTITALDGQAWASLAATTLAQLDPSLRQGILGEVQDGAPMTDIEARRREFEAAGAEYEKHVFDDQTGGYVLIHQGHNRSESFESEVFVAETFARQGYGVKLVNEQGEDGQRRFDALVDGEPWEFKELTEKAENIANRIQRGISGGKKQASQIAYHINRVADIYRINRGVERAILWDEKNELSKIALIFADDSIQVLTAKELKDGRKFQ